MFLLIFSYSSLLVSFLGSKDNDGNLETFRYTQNQRRLETRTKKYNKTSKSIDSAEEIIEKLKKQEIELFKDIKQRYPEMSDGQIRNEIQSYIDKLKLS